jgi:hypothetical protein
MLQFLRRVLGLDQKKVASASAFTLGDLPKFGAPRTPPVAEPIVDYGWPIADPANQEKRDIGGAGDLADFLAGKLVMLVDSSWLVYGAYHPAEQQLELGFKPSKKSPEGFAAYYGNCTPEIARSFAEAPSKGTWVHKNIKGGYNPDGTWVHKLPMTPK